MNPFLLSGLIQGVTGLFGRRDEQRQARDNTAEANAAAREQMNLANRFNVEQATVANRRNVKNTRLVDRINDKNAQVANRFTAQQTRQANRASSRQAAKANRFSSAEAEKARDYNAQQARQANKFSARQANKANEFTAEQQHKANVFTRRESKRAQALTEASALRNREWGKEDYAQQRADMSNQFTDLRAAAEKAGFNPLSVLGSQMVPQMGAGGLSSSSYGSSSGVAGSGVAASGVGGSSSAPMGVAASGVGGSGVLSPVSGVAPASTPMSYGAPVSVAPLVSNAAITGDIAELGRELTGVNATQRANDQLYDDLARIELDQARAGAPIMPTGSAPSVPGVAGLRPAVVPVGSVSASPGMEREYQIAPMVNSGQAMDIERADGSTFPIWAVNGEPVDTETAPLIAGADLWDRFGISDAWSNSMRVAREGIDNRRSDYIRGQVRQANLPNQFTNPVSNRQPRMGYGGDAFTTPALFPWSS